MASAWSMYRIEMSEAEAQAWKDGFYARYPRLRQWQNETANVARATGTLRSVVGRPLRAEWEPKRPLKWTLCCNFPVQSRRRRDVASPWRACTLPSRGWTRACSSRSTTSSCRVPRGRRARGRGAARGANGRRLARDSSRRPGARDRRRDDPPVLGETAEEGVSRWMVSALVLALAEQPDWSARCADRAGDRCERIFEDHEGIAVRNGARSAAHAVDLHLSFQGALGDEITARDVMLFCDECYEGSEFAEEFAHFAYMLSKG